MHTYYVYTSLFFYRWYDWVCVLHEVSIGLDALGPKLILLSSRYLVTTPSQLSACAVVLNVRCYTTLHEP